MSIRDWERVQRVEVIENSEYTVNEVEHNNQIGLYQRRYRVIYKRFG